jgi:threonyl-tRNA synthetase
MLIVGEKEQQEGVVSVRRQGVGDTGAESTEAFITRIRREIENRES